MTGGGPKTRADEIDRQDYLTRRNNELREGEDAYDEAANLLTKRGEKKRAKARKIYKFWRACDTICCTRDKPR